MPEPNETSKRSYSAETANDKAPRLIPGSSSTTEAGKHLESSADARSPQINGELVQRVIERLKGL
jgi:hypothetical protein